MTIHIDLIIDNKLNIYEFSGVTYQQFQYKLRNQMIEKLILC